MTAQQQVPPIVIKVGGSLLGLTDLAGRLRGLFLSLRPARIAVVAGGGEAADLVRHWDQKFGLPDEAAHWLAIRSMGLTEGLLQYLIPEFQMVEQKDHWDAQPGHQELSLLAMESWLRFAESRGESVPPSSWDVTSDTLAAWAAHQIGARDIVLAKSVDWTCTSLEDAAAKGLVDPEFPAAARGLNVQWINLNQRDFQPMPVCTTQCTAQ